MTVQELARRGAALRLHELETERRELEKFLGTPQRTDTRKVRRRRRMSAQVRKAIGIRMRAYWRARRLATARRHAA